MPPRPILNQLPPELREWLEHELVERGFSQYIELTERLNERLAANGLELKVSMSTVARYGSAVEERIEAIRRSTEIARTIARESDDDEGAMNDALIRLVQERLFDVVLKLEIDPEDVKLHQVGRVIADLGRASIAQKKHQAEVKKRAEAAAAEVEKQTTAAGLSAETIAAIKLKILGIAG